MYKVKVGSKFKFQGTTIDYSVLNIASREGEVQALCKFQSTQSGMFKRKWVKMSKIEETFNKYPTLLTY